MTELIRRAFAQGTTKLAWDVAGRGLGFLLTIVLARSLGASGFGEFAVFWYSAFLLAQLSDLGLHLSTLKRLSLDPTAVLGSAVAVKLVLSVVILAAVGLLSPEPIVIALVAAQLFGSWVELFGVALRSRGLVGREGLLVASLRASWILAAGLALFGGNAIALEGIAAGLAFASGLVLLLTLVVVGGARTLSPWGRASLRLARHLIRESLPLAATSVITLVYLRADLFIVAVFHGAHETGVFQSAFRLFEACFVLSGGLVAGTFPLMAARLHTPEFKPLVRFVLGWSVVLATPLALGFGLFPTAIIQVVFGESFVAAARPLAWLGVALLAVFANAVSTHCLVATGRTRLLVGAMLMRLVVGVTLDLVLVPRFGAVGAAAAVAGAEWSLTVASLGMIADRIGPGPIRSRGSVSEELSSCS